MIRLINEGGNILERKISMLLILFLLLAGCQNSNSALPQQTNTLNPVQAATINGSMKSPTPLIQTPISPVGYESGKPKEEPNVPDSGKLVKHSSLVPIYAVSKGTVAITIDDGPTKYTEELLRVLKKNNTQVTFFFLGQNAAAFPQAVTDAVYEGDVIGYHSNSHPKMTAMNLKGQEKEFDLGLSKLKKVDPKPITLFRPPYGAYNNDTKVVTEEHKMSMILWNEDPRDWSTADSAAVVKNVLSQVHSGSIIVMHDRPSTIIALPEIIAGIKKKGFKLVTISSNR
jgi:peptidoglycan/xylan/chitin deacetylase (PgdA/CDA1 family)